MTSDYESSESPSNSEYDENTAIMEDAVAVIPEETPAESANQEVRVLGRKLFGDFVRR